MKLWDAYKADGTKAGFELIRGERIPEGYYHLVCEAVIQHADGEFLLMQRSFKKETYPGKWEIGAGGSALKGEDRLQAVLREIEEETGIHEGACEEIYSLIHEGHQAIYCGFWFTTSFDKKEVRLQEGETIAYKWITKNELVEFYQTECSPTFRERLKGFMESLIADMKEAERFLR